MSENPFTSCATGAIRLAQEQAVRQEQWAGQEYRPTTAGLQERLRQAAQSTVVPWTGTVQATTEVRLQPQDNHPHMKGTLRQTAITEAAAHL